MFTSKRRSNIATSLCAGVAVVLSSVACTGEDRQTGDEVTQATPTGSVPELREREAPYSITLERVVGTMPKQARTRARAAMARPARRWLQQGFVTGPWPRTGFGGAFAGFRPDLKRSARDDVALLTMSRLGGSLTEVVPTRREIRIFAVSPYRRLVGATARVNLKVLGAARSGEVLRVNVRGRLSLTRNANGRWRVFAYDVDRWVDRDVSVSTEEDAR